MLSDERKVVLGTRPVELTVFPHLGGLHVFASSDHPAVIYSRHHQLLFANVNLPDVSRVCPLNAEAFQDR